MSRLTSKPAHARMFLVAALAATSFLGVGAATQSSTVSAVGAGRTLRVNVAQAAGAQTVFGQLTVAGVTDAGFVTAYACDDGIPRDLNGNISKSDLNYDGRVNAIASNRLIVQADNDGNICFYTLKSAHMIIDISGVTAAGVTAIANQRTDTRPATAGPTPNAPDPLARPASLNSGATCSAGIEASDLNAYFSSQQGVLFGADYQRANLLSDGRTLWTFQDAFVRRSNGSLKLVHNVGLIQSGNCFSLLRSGTAADPKPWLLPELTVNEKTWHWPMAAELSTDGSTLHMFVVEMNEQGPGYLGKVVPATNRIVDIRVSDLAVVGYGLAPDSSDELFGFDTASDGTWTYLYGHCYKQFGFGWLGFDDCAQHVKVARVPKGNLKATPTYWDGTRWGNNPASAVSIFNTSDTGEGVNQIDVIWDGEKFRAVAMADWWSSKALFFSADSPQGPWIADGEVQAAEKCDSCNTYYVSWVPWRNSDGSLIWAHSNNRWDGAISSVYRPTFSSFGS